MLTSVAATASLAGAPFSATMGGLWHGIGIQSDGANWSVELTIHPTHATVSYPSLNCGGIFRYSHEESKGLSGIETIEYGLETCYETGDVYLLRHTENRILYMWCGHEDDLTSIAVLARGPLNERRLAADYRATINAIAALDHTSLRAPCTRSQWRGS